MPDRAHRRTATAPCPAGRRVPRTDPSTAPCAAPGTSRHRPGRRCGHGRPGWPSRPTPTAGSPRSSPRPAPRRGPAPSPANHGSQWNVRHPVRRHSSTAPSASGPTASAGPRNRPSAQARTAASPSERRANAGFHTKGSSGDPTASGWVTARRNTGSPTSTTAPAGSPATAVVTPSTNRSRNRSRPSASTVPLPGTGPSTVVASTATVTPPAPRRRSGRRRPRPSRRAAGRAPARGNGSGATTTTGRPESDIRSGAPAPGNPSAQALHQLGPLPTTGCPAPVATRASIPALHRRAAATSSSVETGSTSSSPDLAWYEAAANGGTPVRRVSTSAWNRRSTACAARCIPEVTSTRATEASGPPGRPTTRSTRAKSSTWPAPSVTRIRSWVRGSHVGSSDGQRAARPVAWRSTSAANSASLPGRQVTDPSDQWGAVLVDGQPVETLGERGRRSIRSSPTGGTGPRPGHRRPAGPSTRLRRVGRRRRGRRRPGPGRALPW